MSEPIEEEEGLEATDEQLDLLRRLGVREAELEGLSFAAAEEWIAQLQAMREDAGRIGRD
jgi:hypothetical protein